MKIKYLTFNNHVGQWSDASPKTVALVIYFSAFLCVLGTGCASSQNSHNAWEYKVVQYPAYTAPDEDTLNKLGAEGWMLQSSQNTEGNATVNTTLIFKRIRSLEGNK